MSGNAMPPPQQRADLSRLISPSAIALVGASSNPSLSSGQPLRYLKQYGFAGRFYPVNPNRQEVQGVKSYDSVLALPEVCDVAVVTVAAALVPGVIRDCGTAGIPFAIVLSAGFEDAEGAQSPLQRALKDAIAESGVRVVGPNCTGIVNLRNNSYCAQGGALSDPSLRPGPVAVVSQSGGVGLSMLAFINAAGSGVGCLASSGNEVDIDVFDLADYLLAQADISIVALYVETSVKGRKLRALGRRALALKKPVVVLKAGNAGTARNAATSHTGRLTADYALFRAAFREGGYVEVGDIDEMVEAIGVLRHGRLPRGNRVALQTTSGGWGVMLAERCEHLGLQLPALTEATVAAIRPLVPGFASLANPLDITPLGYKDQYASYNEITRMLLADPAVDLLVVRSATGTDIGVWAEGLLRVVAASDKPVFVHWAPSPNRFEDVRARLEGNGIACFSFVNQIARNVAASVNFAAKAARLAPAAPQAAPVVACAPLPLPDSPCTLSEREAIECLQAYGIAVAKSRFLRREDIANAELPDFRFPLAVKIESADIPHKTDVGGVILNAASMAEVRAAAATIFERVGRAVPQAAINGVLVQEMARGVEMIVGAVNDPHFGPIVMLGMGGVLAEMIDDVTYRFAPVAAADAADMVSELRGKTVLAGMRGEAPRDVGALAETIVRLSQLLCDSSGKIGEIEINPLFVHARGEGVTAADCLITVR